MPGETEQVNAHLKARTLSQQTKNKMNS